jgi:hypothetical protein
MEKSERRIFWKESKNCKVIKVAQKGKDTIVKMNCNFGKLNKKEKGAINKIKSAQDLVNSS